MSSENEIPLQVPRVSDAERREVSRAWGSYMDSNIDGRYFSVNNMYGTAGYRSCLEFGRNLRDKWLHTYPILPGAVITFTDIATSREWMVTGRMVTASRAVWRLNNSFMYDSMGLKHKGFEQLFSRMCVDWLTIGRAMFHSFPLTENERDWSELEYVDPGFMYPTRSKENTYWQYRPRDSRPTINYPQEEIFFMDNIKIGSTGGIVGRLSYLLPIANLAWLTMEHDTLKLDGRKIRDIFIVRSQEMVDAIETGLLQFMALASGEDPSKNRLPVVALEGTNDDTKLSDYITRLGISEVPQDFSREELMKTFVRQVSLTLGISLAHIWQDEASANRALENVQQERSTLKGPAYYVRSFCRLVNNSAMMGTTPGNRAVLTFDEETDNSSRDLAAKALKAYTEAAINVNILAPDMVAPIDWLGYFHKMALIPPNATMPGYTTLEEQSLTRNVDLISGILPWNTSMEDVIRTEMLMNPGTPGEDLMERGFVRMNLNEEIVERRAEYQIGWRKNK